MNADSDRDASPPGVPTTTHPPRAHGESIAARSDRGQPAPARAASAAATPHAETAATLARVVIEAVHPEIDAGRFPIKRSTGEDVVVTADIYADGHEELAAVLRYRRAGQDAWNEVPMTELGNDRWTGRFTVTALGRYEYTLEGWVDRFASWSRDLAKKFQAGQDVSSDLLEGAAIVRARVKAIQGNDAQWLAERARDVAEPGDQAARVDAALDPILAFLMSQHPDRGEATRYDRVLEVWAGRERARFGSWYETFPRSCAPEPARHGTLRDLAARLPYVRDMGFDVLYLPPIHPIGQSFRKGPNNALQSSPDDVGSPWAIGAAEGGHKAFHPALGTLADFDQLVTRAREHGVEIALDIAFQCSPDHPYVHEHPEWFRHRPDGTIKYAENPPKKYQDIYPLDFECPAWRALWDELKSVFDFWIEHGVTIFRVDNPHTKPFRFWEWLIRSIEHEHPETILLAEAFTRPKVMRYLAKTGFTQSYTYFTWRNTKTELIEYFTELTQTDVRETMRPNLFVNTPDILHEFLQFGGRPAFMMRLVLAATLGATYGIYGPPFELCEARAIRGSEEYQDSEKYQLRPWDLDRPGNIREFIALVNRIRRENPALQYDWTLRFYPADNDQLLFYGKTTPDLSNVILVVVSLDPHHVQSGWVRVPLGALELPDSGTYQVHDLLTGARYLWHGEVNFVRLDPAAVPAHIFRVRRKIKTERDFDYYM